MHNYQRIIPERRSRKRLYLLIGILLAVTLLNFTVTLYSQRQEKLEPDNHQLSEWVRQYKNKFPVADYEAPEPTDPAQRAKRRKRSERHDGTVLGVKRGINAPPGSGNESVLNNDWEVRVPRLPAALSDVILVGQVRDANAYISADKNGVYSEFTVQVEEVLKDATASPLSPGNQVAAERQGGRVRYPSGRVEWFHINAQSMPTVNSRYVLFLKHIDSDSFSIITGYELRDGRVYALDSGASQFTFYDGSEELSFLQLVREAMTTR